MSWDVIFFVLDSPPPPVPEIPNDWQPPEFEVASLRETISADFPAIDWSAPSWGLLTGPDWSIEFNLGDAPRTQSVTLHVRGRPEAMKAITQLMSHPGWYAMDTSADAWIHHMDAPDNGFAAFRVFRDKALTQSPPKPAQPGLLARILGYLRR